MSGTVRFARVVETCGQPEVHTLWVEPEKDRELQRALRAHRVMTVHRARGKAEYGTIGFEKSAGGTEQYLLFPKSLQRFTTARVVGVKFDLIAQPKLASFDANLWTAPPRVRTAKKKAVALPTPIPFPQAPPSPEPEPVLAGSETELTAEKSLRPAANAKRELTKPPARPKRPKKRAAPPAISALAEEVRAALKELEAGKTVAAFRRLERALEKTEE